MYSGDEVPHPPSYTSERINWWNELDALIKMGIKVSDTQKIRQRPFDLLTGLWSTSLAQRTRKTIL